MTPKISSIRNTNNIDPNTNTEPTPIKTPHKRKIHNYAPPTSTERILNESFSPLSKEDQKALKEALKARKLNVDTFESKIAKAVNQAGRKI